MAKKEKIKDVVAQLDKDFEEYQRLGTMPPLDANLKAALSQKSRDLEVESKGLESTIVKLKAYYDAGNMISLKNDAIKDDIDDAVALLKETKEQRKIVNKVLSAWR